MRMTRCSITRGPSPFRSCRFSPPLGYVRAVIKCGAIQSASMLSAGMPQLDVFAKPGPAFSIRKLDHWRREVFVAVHVCRDAVLLGETE
jgi:hypothetical protein